MNPPPKSLRHLGTGDTPAYHLLSKPGEQPVRISFPGIILGISTIWEASLWTVSQYPRSHPCPAGKNQLMEIGATEDGMTPITIVLNLPEINEGAILKTLIMVNKYKRLRPGLICFGGQSRNG